MRANAGDRSIVQVDVISAVFGAHGSDRDYNLLINRGRRMNLPHFFVLLIILFVAMAASIAADYLDVDRREARRRRELAEVTPFPAPSEQKRAA